MIVFITHGDGPRGAERALRNLLTNSPTSIMLSVISMGKRFGLPVEHYVTNKLMAVVVALREVERGLESDQQVTLCYVNGHMAVPFIVFLIIRLRSLLRRERIRLVLWEHCLPHTHYERRIGGARFVIRSMYTCMLSMADAVIAPSSVIGDDLKRYFGGIGSTVLQLNNPIILEPASSMQLPIEWPGRTATRILFVGSLTREKQPHLALDWVSANRGSNVHLLLCGDGLLREELQNRIIFENIPATIVGYVGNLRDYYQQADLLLCTSSYETYSNVMMEAVMCGCHVLTTDWPGVESLYGNQPLVRIHSTDVSPVFEVYSLSPRPDPSERLTNFVVLDYIQHLEGRN